MNLRLATLGLISGTLLAGGFTPVLAQHSGDIEEIIVTARQQEETLQDVPVTISALTEADLKRYNITNLVDAAKMVVAHSGAGNANVTGFVGGTYDFPVRAGWRLGLSTDFRYTGEYAWTATIDPLMQDSFWIIDAAVSLYSEDGRHQFNLIGRNVADEIYIAGGGGIPGRCPNVNYGPPATCNNTGPNSLDQAATTQLGRTLSLQLHDVRQRRGEARLARIRRCPASRGEGEAVPRPYALPLRPAK